MKTNDGGPAFPNRGDNTPDNPIFDGMSLRDWFAGQAVVGLMAGINSNPVRAAVAKTENTARQCYELADAMLAQRAKTPTPEQ